MPNEFHKNLTDDNIHALPARTYTDITARDADTVFNTDAANINKKVRVDSPASYFMLFSIGPAVWIETSSTGSENLISLLDTPSTYAGQAGKVLQVNAAEDATEFGQALRATDSPTFLDLTLTGDFLVQGTVTTINTTTLLVEDKNIELGVVTTPTDLTADGGGITLKGTTDKTITWVNSTDSWNFNQDVIAELALAVGGTVAVPTSVGLDMQSTDQAILLNRLTTTQRDALTALEGMHIWNTTLKQAQNYDGTSWVDMAGGDISGPPSSVVNSVPTFSTTLGKNIQDQNAMFISSGDVGIGVITPNDKLHVNVSGTSGYTHTDRGVLITDSLGPRVTFEDAGESVNNRVITLEYESQNLAFSSMSDDGLSFDNQNLLVINRDGQVNVGTGSTASNLTIDTTFGQVFLMTSSDASGPNFALQATATGGDTWFFISTATSNPIGGGHLRMRNSDLSAELTFLGTGKLGIGDTAPDSTLDVAGDINISAADTGYKIDDSTVLFASNTTFSTLVGIGAGGTPAGAGFRNTAVGYQTLLNIGSGNEHVAVGYQALLSITTGFFNTAVGNLALAANLAGNSCTAVGHSALTSNLGTNNSALGHQSLGNNTTGTGNAAFGNDALLSNISGSANAAFGFAALEDSTGANNTAVGSESLQKHTAGNFSTALGARAGKFISGGVTPNILSSTSLYLGADTEALASGDVNEIVIGDQATGIGSNSVVLGNDSIVKTALKGSVGIGTTDPAAPLDIVVTGDGAPVLRLGTDRPWTFQQEGSGSGASLRLRNTTGVNKLFHIDTDGSSQWRSADGSTVLMKINQGTGQLSIGTTTPDASSLLDVASTTKGSLSAPRMTTTQKDAIASPATSLRAFDTTRGRHEFFDGTKWKGLEEGPLNVVYFTDASQLPAPSGGVITLDAHTTYIAYNDNPSAGPKVISFTDRIAIPDAGGVVIRSVGLVSNFLVYTGTGAFFTSSSSFIGNFTIRSIVIQAPNGSIFDLDGVLPIGQEFRPRLLIETVGMSTGAIGTIKTINVTLTAIAFAAFDAGLILDGVEQVTLESCDFLGWTNTASTVMLTFKNTLRLPRIINCVFETNPNETVFNIGPHIGDAAFIISGNSYQGDGQLYATGASGSYTSIINVDHGGNVSSVAGTPSGECVMTTTAAHSIAEGEVVKLTTFTDPNYNGTFEVLEVVSATEFRIHTPFTATGSGVWEGDRIQFFAVNSLAVGDPVQITDTTPSVAGYDGEYRVLGASGTAFFVSGAFTQGATGNFNTDSLTETDPIMRVIANVGMPDSKVLAVGTVNSNTDVTTVADGAYGTMDLSTSFVASSVNQRFDLTSADEGEFTYQGNEPIEGSLTATISTTKSGVTASYRFAVSIDGATPVFASAQFLPMEIANEKVSATLLSPVSLTTGQTIRILIAGDGTSDDLTITDFAITVTD